MRHTKRFFLIPEGIFETLLQQNDGSPIGLVKKRMRQIENNGAMNEEERATKYQQEYKRLNKLTQDVDDQPVNVNFKNPQISLQQQTQKQPVKTPKSSKQARPKSLDPPIKVFDDDEWDDAVEKSPLKLRQPKKAFEPAELQNYPLTKRKVMDYIKQNSKDLGVTTDQKVLKADGQVYKTSNVEEIVSYLLNKDRKSQFKNFPVGYKEFVERAKLHSFLEAYLFPEKPHQFGSGLTSFKINKKNTGQEMIKFKPQLWC